MFFGKMRPIKGKGDTGQTSPGVTGDVTVSIDSSEDVVTISPYIYGGNHDFDDFPATARRQSGNVRTAYNWVDGFLNFGQDWGPWYNYGDGAPPGQSVETHVQGAFDAGYPPIVAIQMCGYVAADGIETAAVQATNPERFHNTVAEKGTAFSLTPTTASGNVYQDEFVNWLLRTFEETPGQNDTPQPVFYSLDNEPALWNSTHANTHPGTQDYAEVTDKGIEYSTAIKAVNADAKVLGPVVWGWPAMTTLQYHSDFDTLGDFTEYYLSEMNAASVTAGVRLLDYLDYHWYPHAQRAGTAIPTPSEWVDAIVTPTPAQYDAILQSVRSLWDPTYLELSWVANEAGNEPLQIIPRMKERIANNYPGTGMAITEYNYGSHDHIIGGLAQADVLGVFGREGVFMAMPHRFEYITAYAYTYAAFFLYRDFDGSGKQFGDTSIQCTHDSVVDDIETASIYAAVDDGDASRMTVVAINKTNAALSVGVNITHNTTMLYGQSYILDDQSSLVKPSVTIDDLSVNTFTYSMPAYSASMIELSTTDNHYVPPVVPGGVPESMPKISHDVPVYTNPGSDRLENPNGHVVDGNNWQPGGTSGWLAYDLSGVPEIQRGQVVFHFDDWEYSYYYGSASPATYTIDAHAAAGGGSPPAQGDGGWQNLETVSSTPNIYSSREHLVDMTNYNWLRLNVFTSTNYSISVHVDIHDAHLGYEDSWLTVGDSNSAGCLMLNEYINEGSGPAYTAPNWPQAVAAGTSGTHYPIQQNAGMGGWTSVNGLAALPNYLDIFGGRYVCIAFGTNDAGDGVPVSTFRNNYNSMVDLVIAAGKIPVIPTIPWVGSAEGQQATYNDRIILLNAELADLKVEYPVIVDGPDFWTYFFGNNVLMDGLHPTNEGRTEYRTLWAETMLTNVYGV